jgi:hypothetical protein
LTEDVKAMIKSTMNDVVVPSPLIALRGWHVLCLGFTRFVLPRPAVCTISLLLGSGQCWEETESLGDRHTFELNKINFIAVLRFECSNDVIHK